MCGAPYVWIMDPNTLDSQLMTQAGGPNAVPDKTRHSDCDSAGRADVRVTILKQGQLFRPGATHGLLGADRLEQVAQAHQVHGALRCRQPFQNYSLLFE